MELFLAWLLRQMHRARIVFVGLYLLVMAGFIYAEPRSAWTRLIVFSATKCFCVLNTFRSMMSHTFL